MMEEYIVELVCAPEHRVTIQFKQEEIIQILFNVCH